MKSFIETDKVSGVDVIQLTSGDFSCHHPYFFYDPWINEDRLVFYSNMNGKYLLYVLDTTDSRCLQLTDLKTRRFLQRWKIRCVERYLS